MKLLKTIHRSSGHSAKISLNEYEGFYRVEYYQSGKPIIDKRYIAETLHDASDTAELELMVIQDQDE